MRRLENQCTCPDDAEKYFETCPACEEWWQQNSVLVDELKLKPWEFPAVEKPDDEGPDLEAQARYRLMKKAAKQHARADR